MGAGLTRDPDALLREIAKLTGDLSLIERRRYKRQFTMTLANLSHVEMYWSPSRRRVLARAAKCSRRFTLPLDAMLIGEYAHPFNVNDFLGDLDDLLAKIEFDARLFGIGTGAGAPA